ncbi:MAG: phosphodiesterase [Gammaproteobacteria bacterium]|jgi:diguanylate cyclase (GGDEF)-like protein|nr:phosphodiesterase [Gammaproteobacteria bacterium]
MGSFRNRLLVLIIGLVIVTQTVTLAAVLASTAHNVEARAAEQLRSGGSFVQQLIRFRAGQLANGVAVLAADFGFREAVASGDVPTILSAARNNAQRIGADIVLLLDTRGGLLASTAPEMGAGDTSLEGLLLDTHGPRDQPSFMVFGRLSYQFFLAPVRTPDTIAWVAMGFVVDDSLAQKIRDLAGAQVTFVSHGRDGVSHVASTLPVAQRSVAADPMPSMGGKSEAPHVVQFAETDYLSFSQRLDARGDAIEVILLKPMHEVLMPYRDVRDALLLIDGIALALAAAVGTLLGRSATRPIGELVMAARRIQEGRYETAVEVSGGAEFRSLAATFNAMQKNIAEREADITHHAYHDALTELPNRTLAERRLDDLVSGAQPPAAFALILIDMRNVHDINASLGHHVGDEVLREASRRLRQNAHPDDIVARLGESQFLVIAHNCCLERSPLYADQLTGVIRTGFHLSGVSLDLHVTCGVCVYPDHGDTADKLLRRVQIALEDSHDARTRVAIYRPGRDEEHRRRLTLITDLRGAIDRDGLSLVYQPKVTMATRSVKSLEALVRWTHPQLGPISPAEFVPLAESTGGSRRLTSWVLKAAIGQMAEWRRTGLDVEVAVNLSAPDILDPELGDEILSLLRAGHVEATQLLLEITESAVMRDPHLAARNMQLLRVAGVRFAIDDFGTGHSSLSQLSMLPVDELKIDRSFITHARLGSDATTIVTSTIELGHRMGLNVVAEGVEEPEAWNLLRQLGCDFAQGFLISRPLVPADVPAFVRQANQLLPASDSTVLQIRALDQLATRFRR